MNAARKQNELEGGKMPDYRTMYFKLAAKIADTIETLDKISQDLRVAQIETEEMYINSEDGKEE